MLAVVVCPLLALVVALWVERRAAPDERKLVLAGFAAHIAGTFAIVAYHEWIYGSGDMFLYEMLGSRIAQTIARDGRYAAETLKLIFHLPNDLPVDMFQGSTSGTMMGLMALFIYALGDTKLGASLLVSLFAFVGQLSMYRAVREHLHPTERKPVLAAALLLPSVAFWASGFVKEGVAMGFLGMLCSGAMGFLGRRSVMSLVVGVGGAIGLALVKPYILFPFVLAVGGWFVAGRPGKLALGYKIFGAIVAVGGLVLISQAFPEFGLDKLGENVARHQKSATLIYGGGSDIEVGDYEDTTTEGQLRYAPLGLFNALARPVIFEARNVTMLVAAVEMTVILVFIYRLLARHGPRVVWNELRTRPPHLFCAVFVVAFGAAVGLATTNLGTLSRYRVPMMPMYLAPIVALRASLGARTAKERVAVRGVRRGATASRGPRLLRTELRRASSARGRMP